MIKEYGRGNRQRKQVNYTEDLSDNVWMKMLEDGLDPSEMNERAEEYREEVLTFFFFPLIFGDFYIYETSKYSYIV